MIKLLLVVSIIATSFAANEKCRIIALKGGGDKGGYQAGVLKGLVEFLPAGEAEYDVIVGVSVGSLNGALLAISPIGSEKAAVEELIDTWLSIKDYTQIYENWAIPIISALTKSSVFSTEPLKQLLTSKVQNRKLERQFFAGVADRNEGKFHSINANETVESSSDLVELVLASSAIPALFENREYKGRIYIDGGSIDNLDTFTGINYCYSKGFADEDIIIDSVGFNAETVEPFDHKGKGIFSLLNRVINLVNMRADIEYVEAVRKAFPNVIWRHMIVPDKKLENDFLPIKFDPELTRKYVEQGYEQVKAMLGK